MPTYFNTDSISGTFDLTFENKSELVRELLATNPSRSSNTLNRSSSLTISPIPPSIPTVYSSLFFNIEYTVEFDGHSFIRFQPAERIYP